MNHLHLMKRVIPIWMLIWSTMSVTSDPSESEIMEALRKSGDNRPEILKAFSEVKPEHREGMKFLIDYMPERDLKTLSADFLLENVEYAYLAWETAPWHEAVSNEIFLNYILPYCNLNERRDEWRKEFMTRFKPLIQGVITPSKAAVAINQALFPQVNVKYSTRRAKADQSPYETLDSGLASCTGLSILLIDVCRALGIPARFVGTPLWSDGSGNHSWIEVWDQGWHFTGAAEPTGDELDQGWFVLRASKAEREVPMHAIYAVSYKKTPILFPTVWDKTIDYIYAVNVTDRYVSPRKTIPAGSASVFFKVTDKDTGDRCSAQVRVLGDGGKVFFEGVSKDERFDANDHVTAILPKGKTFRLKVQKGGTSILKEIEVRAQDQLIQVDLN